MIAPMLVGVMLANAFPMSGIFMLFAAVFVMISGTVLFFGRESKQQTLEELEQSLD